MNQIEKEKKGFKLFFHILKNHFFTLIFLNLVFIITCIPIITIGPASKAMAKVTMNIVRDNDFEIFRSYFTELKNNFWKTAIIGTLITIILGTMGYLILLNLKDPELTNVLRFFVVFSIVLIMYLSAVTMYVLKLFATIDLPTKEIWKNAFLLVFMSPKQMLILVVLVVIPSMFYILYLDIGITFFIIWHFSMSSVISSINAWSIIKKYVATEYREDNNQENDK